MDITYIFIFIFGTIIGSFLNAFTFRYGTGFSLLSRSCCFSCNKNLEWWELIPVLSFIFLRGRCSSCRARISYQYPLIEISVGFLFLFLYQTLEPVLLIKDWVIFFLYASLFSAFVAILIYDIRHKIIPDGLVIFAGVMALLIAFLSNSTEVFLNHIIAGLVLPAPFVALWFISKGRMMGLGDGKLISVIGIFLGMYYGFSALVISFWSGAIVGILLIAFSFVANLLLSKGRGELTMKSEMPFAPFLILGTFAVFFFGIDIISLLAVSL